MERMDERRRGKRKDEAEGKASDDYTKGPHHRAGVFHAV